MQSTVQTTALISNLRAKVTGADVNYVGSVTIDAVLCDYVGIFDRQLLHIRNESTGVDLWTYVIYGRRSSSVPPGTVCLNGAAAHLVSVGDVVNLTAWGRFPACVSLPEPRTWDAVVNGFEPPLGYTPDELWAHMASVEIAIGKIHRPRISQVCEIPIGGGHAPSIAVDKDWADEAGLLEGQVAHLVNITTGQRDVLPIKYASAGSKACILSMPASGVYATENYGSRSGHFAGDIVIVMCYATVMRSALKSGSIPSMKISFPCERAEDAEDPLDTSWYSATRIVWEEPKLAAGLVDLLDLKRPGLRVLDCSCGNAFPATYLIKAGVDLHLSDCSELVCTSARERLAEELGPDHGVDVRCVQWDKLACEYGKQSFDVIIWRGVSLPYVEGGCCSATSIGRESIAATGYRNLHSAAAGIFNVLAPGGKLYVDCVPSYAENGKAIKKDGLSPETESGAQVTVEWETRVDEEQRSRKWSSTTTIDKDGQSTRTMNSNLTALLVREQEIRSVLSYVGFGVVESTTCDGEDVYQPFIAHKPTAEIGYYDRQVERYRSVWNDNGKILWGLFAGVAPYVMTPEMTEMSSVCGKGALVGPNLAMQAFMVSKLDPITVKSILDVGCGTGRSTIDLSKHFSTAQCVGCDPSGVSIRQGVSRAKDEGVSDRTTFFHGTVQDLIASGCVKGAFSAAWSEAALCHAPPGERADAIRAIADHVEDGGMFVLNDAVAGLAPVSAAAQLHFYERLHYTGLWTGRMYMELLESCGLQIIEYVDLTQHLAASYDKLAEEAKMAADASGEDVEARQTFATLAVDYKISAECARRGELGWNLFVCKKLGRAGVQRQNYNEADSEEKKLD